MKKLLDFLTRYQIALILTMLALGFIFPNAFKAFNPYNTPLLQIIMFTTGLRLDFNEVFREMKDWRTMLLTNAMKLAIIPFLISIPLALFAPQWLLPFVIIGTMPTGLTAPPLVAILNGQTSLALVAAATTSALAPFTIPLILKALVGHDVHMDTVGMMWQIAQAVLLPLILAGIIQRLIGRARIEIAASPIRAVGLAAFALVVASITSASAIAAARGGQSVSSIGMDGLVIATLMLFFWIGVSWLASAFLSWRSPKDRATITFCLIYMNYTLAIWVGDTFFRAADIAPKLVAIIILVIALVPAFRLLFPKPKKKVVGPVCMVDVHA
jgi:bile acid:Na+ symporter, BASS family